MTIELKAEIGIEDIKKSAAHIFMVQPKVFYLKFLSNDGLQA